MTANELHQHFNDTFQLNQWPKHYVVDAETYANVCQWQFENGIRIRVNGLLTVDVYLGPNNGILFKGVELILAKS